MTARVSMLLKLRASLTCFRACFLPVRAKDLSAPWYSPAFKCTSPGSEVIISPLLTRTSLNTTVGLRQWPFLYIHDTTRHNFQQLQQHRDASCHQVSFPARQGAEGNSRHSDRNISLFPSCCTNFISETTMWVRRARRAGGNAS